MFSHYNNSNIQSYTTSPTYVETESTRRMKRYRDDVTPTMVRSMYEVYFGLKSWLEPLSLT